MNIDIFNSQQRELSNKILNSEYSKLVDLNTKDIKELAIVWCYYSAKIEGNTYTYVETEALLKDNITSTKRYEEAKMLKNLYNTFVSELRYIHNDKNIELINEQTLFRVHKLISQDLVYSEESGSLRSRAVRISGTQFTPPSDLVEIKFKLAEIFYYQDKIKNPLEQAVFLHCNLAKLQPFIDGNKRTVRMIESISLMNNGIIPIYSTKEEDIINYRSALIEFYETNNYDLYVEYFLNKQYERIIELERVGI